MRIVCWQTILMKYHTLFFSKIREDVAKFVCCSRDWRFKGYYGVAKYDFNVEPFLLLQSCMKDRRLRFSPKLNKISLLNVQCKIA